jgi:hypothetical protein
LKARAGGYDYGYEYGNYGGASKDAEATALIEASSATAR